MTAEGQTERWNPATGAAPMTPDSPQTTNAASVRCDDWLESVELEPAVESGESPVRSGVGGVLMQRVWAMPSADTFDVHPIACFVQKYLAKATLSIDPFARNKRWATHTNDLNPETRAEHHMDAEEFLWMLRDQGVRADLAILDPPYSPRQIAECYKAAGRSVGMKETQNAALYSRVKHALAQVLAPDAVVLSFGWNSAGLGKKYGMEIIELLTVCHGGAHNDTICIAEKQPTQQQRLL